MLEGGVAKGVDVFGFSCRPNLGALLHSLPIVHSMY